MVDVLKAMSFPFLRHYGRMLFACVSLSLASACTEVQRDHSETFAELEPSEIGEPAAALSEEENDASTAANANSTDVCAYLSDAVSKADIDADDAEEVESDSDTPPAPDEADPCRQLERKTAEQKLARLRAVNRQADLYTAAEAILAEMDRNGDGVLSGDELNPNARIIQSYMSKQPSDLQRPGQPPGSVSASLVDQNVSLFVSDLAVILLEYFEMSDKNANGVLDPNESEWLAGTVYPDEAAAVARLSED